MDNRKRALSESDWSEETGSRFWQEPDFGKLVGKQEQAGFGTTDRTDAPVRVGAGSKGIKFRILLPLPTFVQVLSKALRAPKP